MVRIQVYKDPKGFQEERLRRVLDAFRERRPDLEVEVIETKDHAELLKPFSLTFGPAIVVDGRLEFVGMPRLRMLVERVHALERGVGHTGLPVTHAFWRGDELPTEKKA